MADDRLVSPRLLLETCNGFGEGEKSGREALEWIHNTYFSLSRDPLALFSPFEEGRRRKVGGKRGPPLFSNLRYTSEMYVLFFKAF